MSNEIEYEYKIISGRENWPAKSHQGPYAGLSEELNLLAKEGWEPFQSSGTSQGFLAFGTGGSGGQLVIILRRPKS